MAARRKDDEPISRTRFRTDRMVQDGGRWFFLTRENTVEGPFDCREEALEQLEIYLKLAVNDYLMQESVYALQA